MWLGGADAAIAAAAFNPFVRELRPKQPQWSFKGVFSSLDLPRKTQLYHQHETEH